MTCVTMYYFAKNQKIEVNLNFEVKCSTVKKKQNLIRAVWNSTWKVGLFEFRLSKNSFRVSNVLGNWITHRNACNSSKLCLDTLPVICVLIKEKLSSIAAGVGLWFICSGATAWTFSFWSLSTPFVGSSSLPISSFLSLVSALLSMASLLPTSKLKRMVSS